MRLQETLDRLYRNIQNRRLSPEDKAAIDVIAGDLGRGYRFSGPFEPRGSMQSWRETLFTATADGTQILNSTTEAVLVPNFQLPANYLYAGRTLKWTVLFDVSTVITTPGTVTLRLRYGTNTAPASNTSLAASGAFAPDPTAASTTVSHAVQWYFVARATGTAASSYTMGIVNWNDYDDASATTIVGNLAMQVAPASAPAAVNIDTTTQNYLQPSLTFSVATATTQATGHIGILEALT